MKIAPKNVSLSLTVLSSLFQTLLTRIQLLDTIAMHTQTILGLDILFFSFRIENDLMIQLSKKSEPTITKPFQN